VLWAQTSPLGEMMWSCTCFPCVINIPTLTYKYGCFESFPLFKNFLFSSTKPGDFDGMLGTELPVSRYATKTPIYKCRFNVTLLKDFFFYIFCKRQITIKLFYLY
jgi:hypothetical protein